MKSGPVYTVLGGCAIGGIRDEQRLRAYARTIGDTPVLRINRLAPADVELFVKPESFNPMASVKDRIALSVIERAKREGAPQRG